MSNLKEQQGERSLENDGINVLSLFDGMSDKSLLDQYYTKPEVAEYYSNFIKERFGDDCSYFEQRFVDV
jgi:hypothetical protein